MIRAYNGVTATDMLYYSHVNEDNRIERDVLHAAGSKTIVAVAGSGERVIALLDNDAVSEIHAVDVNEDALFLLQLKLAALKVLSVEDYLMFCGHNPAAPRQRENWFGQIQGELSACCKRYWMHHIASIRLGVVHTGHFEKFLRRIRPFLNLFLGRNFRGTLTEKGIPKSFPQKRWKLLLGVFSMRFIYRLWGNEDAAFISQDATVSYIPSALDEMIGNGKAHSSFMFHLIFNGHLSEMRQTDTPPSLQNHVLEKAKSRLSSSRLAVHYHTHDLLSFVQTYKDHFSTPVFYSLSDMLSFENTDYLRDVSALLQSQRHTIVWRTFLRNRADKNSFCQVLGIKQLDEHTADESTGMYQVFASAHQP